MTYYGPPQYSTCSYSTGYGLFGLGVGLWPWANPRPTDTEAWQKNSAGAGEVHHKHEDKKKKKPCSNHSLDLNSWQVIEKYGTFWIPYNAQDVSLGPQSWHTCLFNQIMYYLP